MTLRHQLQDKPFPVDDDRVSGVVAPGVAGHDGKVLRQDVDDLAFALIAPLGANDDRGIALVQSNRLPCENGGG
jgi:hypothetical protein